MRAVDTNVLVRLVTRDDARQAATADRFVEQGAWVSWLALAEMAWVLESVYELNADGIATSIQMLLDHKDLILQEPETVAAALVVFQNHRKAGFSDCLMLAIARKAGHLPLATFDRDLGRIDGAQRL